MNSVVKQPSNLQEMLEDHFGSKHEEGEDLHKVINPSILATSVFHSRTQRLRNNGANFSGCSTETVSRRTISGWEHLARNDKCGRVGAKILEEV